MPDLTLAVCTFRRPEVGDAIQSLLTLTGIDLASLDVVVVDDDPQASARDSVLHLAPRMPFSLRYVHAGTANVASARNACLDAASGSLLAFIDDDQKVSPTWLSALLRLRQETGAAVVKSTVVAVYPASTPDWVRKADPYTRDYGPDGTILDTAATGGVLIDLAPVRENAIRFDPDKGRNGGEDVLFFNALHRRGVKMVSARSSRIFEMVPDDRVSVPYLKSRWMRYGQTNAQLYAATMTRRWQPAATAACASLGHGICGAAARLAPGALRFKLQAKSWYFKGLADHLARNGRAEGSATAR